MYSTLNYSMSGLEAPQFASYQSRPQTWDEKPISSKGFYDLGQVQARDLDEEYSEQHYSEDFEDYVATADNN